MATRASCVKPDRYLLPDSEDVNISGNGFGPVLNNEKEIRHSTIHSSVSR